MTTPNDTCPHCTHAWAKHVRTFEKFEMSRCTDCGCLWTNPADIPPPPEPPNPLIVNIANAIWGELQAQAESDPFGACVDRENSFVDGEIDMTAVAKAVATIFIDDQDDCTSCHSPCAISEWAEPINGAAE